MRLPKILTQFTQHKIVQNIFWISADKLFRLAVGFFTGILVAKFLGPSEFGRLNYALAALSILTTVISLGIDNFIVKEIVEAKHSRFALLGTSFVLRCLALAAGVIFFLLIIGNEEPADRNLFLILLLTVLFNPLDVIDFEFQAELKSKRTVVIKNIAYVAGALCKVLGVIFKCKLFYFAAVLSGEAMLSGLLLLSFYQFKWGDLGRWKWDLKLARLILSRAWPFILSNVTVILYMRLDQIMLGRILSQREVGYFSAAVRLIEVFTFIPVAVASSILPSLVKRKEELSNEQFDEIMIRFFTKMLYISFVVALPVSLLSPWIISVFYGAQFEPSAAVLSVQVWSLIAIFAGVASSQYLVLNNLNRYSLYRTLVGLILNVVFNIYLIPRYGPVGAALSTLIAQFSAAYLSHFFFRGTRHLFTLQIKSVSDALRMKL